MFGFLQESEKKAFDTRELCTKTEVGPCRTEGHVMIWSPSDIKSVGIGKDRGVTIRGAVVERELVSCFNLLSTYVGRFLRGPSHINDRARKTEQSHPT